MKLKFIFFSALIIGALFSGYLLQEPLNVKNNNPMNVKYLKANQWQGSVYTKEVGKQFEVFLDKNYGLRTGLIVVYSNMVQTDSVQNFVLRFGTEGNEGLFSKHIKNYIKHLEKGLGYSGQINKKDLYKLAKLIIQFEGGYGALKQYEDSLKLFEKNCNLDLQCIRDFY